MKAVFITDFVGPEGLEYRDVDDPAPPVGRQILVRIRGAGLNRADLLQSKGKYPPPPGYSPNRPGMEFSGEIAAVGNNVDGFSLGDRVCGIVAAEAQSQFLLTDDSLVSKIPSVLSFSEAAAVPEAFITAHDAMFTQASLLSAESVLIHAVGSGVGLAALQLAKAKGCRTLGTSRTQEKLDRCLEFGLDIPILADASTQFSESVRKGTDGSGANVILDLVGGSYFAENLASIAVKGRLMLVGLTGGRNAELDLGMVLSKRASIRGTVLRGRSTEEKAQAIRSFTDEVIPLLSEGRVRPNLDKVFPADEVVEAYKYLESNNSFGKVVLEF